MSIDREKRIELGDFIKILLVKYHVRQTEIADICNISRQYVNQICSGKNPMSAEQYKRIFKYFHKIGVSASELKILTRLHISSKLNMEMLPEIQNPVAKMISDKLDGMTDESLLALLRKQEELIRKQEK